MTATSTTKAVADVLSCIATNLQAAGEVLNCAVQADAEDKDALIVAALALLGAAGQLADRAAVAQGDVGTKSADAWIHSPMACAALARLKA